MSSPVIAVAVSAYLVPSIDVCPPVQEDLDDLEVAAQGSPVEGSPFILSETQKDNTNTQLRNMGYKYDSTQHHTYLII
jgi:hypothetical protein